MRALLCSFLLLSSLSVSSVAIARDLTRYPDDSVKFASNISVFVKGSFKGVFPLGLQVGIDETFGVDEREIIHKALEILMSRALSGRVIDCAYRNSEKDMPTNKSKFESQLFESLRPIQNGDLMMPALAFISRYS